jgi:hypothetical protein
MTFFMIKDRSNASESASAEYAARTIGHRVLFVVNRDITPGEELLVSHGDAYWGE